MKHWIQRWLIAIVGLAIFGAAGLALGAHFGSLKAQRHIALSVQVKLRLVA